MLTNFVCLIQVKIEKATGEQLSVAFLFLQIGWLWFMIFKLITGAKRW